MCGTLRPAILAAVVALLTAAPDWADTREKVPVILDTDIGNDIDDVLALALAVASPELDLRAVTTVGEGAEDRAWIVCRFLTAVDRRDVPIAWGRDPQPKGPVGDMIQYRRHPSVLFNRTAKPVKESAVELMYAKLKADPGKITLVALGPLTNVARLLKEHPDCKPWVKRIVVRGGLIPRTEDDEPQIDPNFAADVAAARDVAASGIPLTVVQWNSSFPPPTGAGRFFDATTPLAYQVRALHQLSGEPTPSPLPALAVAQCFANPFTTTDDLRLAVDAEARTNLVNGRPNARVVRRTYPLRFFRWCADRIAAGQPVEPKAPGNVVKPIERGAFPNRVHVAEDFETDIERRWWLSGTPEAGPEAGGNRFCRGVLTQDLDDKMGDAKAIYTAVVFNPVPGPPMGKAPRLTFRYRLRGTHTLRVQIYSLSNGYHRHLTLAGLPQHQWESATVEMTQARRPDGSGGPLSEGERIDDIQFYVDPRADLLIDDIVLYDAAKPDENRPFPKGALFTGGFDTGKQGKEWPGTFEVASKQGHFWHAARSVANADGDAPGVRVHLRGERPLGERTRVFFRYRLTGADALTVTLANGKTKATHSVELKGLDQARWAEADADFAAKFRKGDRVDELLFRLPKGAELLLDDVLLYTPGD